ncbi:uncharacterized protein [Elaeis guineensis]|uniref:Uncharacterized protein LOC105040899 n=1 Tax=Elaeis guineensis var. tenera TaxID=51953 RepID=A0A6I9QVB8_ELAGV|nr:uncharacterized protein LOC105040899 [Elaeis guineensis]XP_010915949.1 uncharacterized protein LOC105040899 [Elaeis guineensis]XP_010915950.1 uncharacterized protein LOC105040899 [Elaeis guineensis]XP_010915951.1 uncharacterized protein LOC105040899 [Elaeis guineensis]XP_029119149.1 uncharacterized protein LOC105040899 [Elaeis guineensis]
MDVSSAPLLKTTNFFCRVSSLRSNPTSVTLFKKNPLRKGADHFVDFSKIPSWRPSAASIQGALEISAHFRRPSRRRNTLREKLIPYGEERKVSKVTELLNPDSSDSNYINGETKTDNSESSSNFDSERVVDGGSSANPNLSGKSVLLNKLEKWVDRYKNDSEFWGVGAGPIFTIYQDTDGKVSRVSVSEDEITKRSQIRVWSLEEKESTDEFMDVNSKISRAKLIAKQIESGQYVLPRNSSIAKFVVEGKKFSFVDGLRSISLQSGPILKISPQIGFTVLCGCYVFWAMTKLFAGNHEVELTREEVEMLRRKKKSRMEGEEMKKGSIKVIEDVPEFPTTRRPQLDKNELMKNIMQAKASTEKLAITDISSHFYPSSSDFDDQVREIREMVSKVHELEQQDYSQNDKKGEEDGVASILLGARDQNVSNENNANAEAASIKEGSNHDNTSEIDLLEDQEKNGTSSVFIENKKLLGENSMGNMNDAPGAESLNTSANSNRITTVKVDDQNEEKTTCSKDGKSVKVDIEHTVHSGNTNVFSIVDWINEETSGKMKMESSMMEEKESSRSSSDFLRTRPKIIRSVKEAREYLARKHGPLQGKVQADQEMQIKELAAKTNACSFTYDDNPIVRTSQSSRESSNVPVPNKLHHDNVSDTRSHGDGSMIKTSSIMMENSEVQGAETVNDGNYRGKSLKPLNVKGGANSSFSDDSEIGKMLSSNEMLLGDVAEQPVSHASSSISRMRNLSDEQTLVQDQNDGCIFHTSDNSQESKAHSIYSDKSTLGVTSDVLMSGMTTPSKNDAVYNSQESETLTEKEQSEQKTQLRRLKNDRDICDTRNNEDTDGSKGGILSLESRMAGSSTLDMTQNVTLSSVSSSKEPTTDKKEIGDDNCRYSLFGDNISGEKRTASSPKFKEAHDMKVLSRSGTNFSGDSDGAGCLANEEHQDAENSWVNKNFQEFGPVIKKIGIGFKENYMVAKEKVKEQQGLSADIRELGLMEEDEELEWLNDENLREIVFQVRENELAGKDPFHLMDPDDKNTFFEGLERKAEKVNEKLLGLHEWVHSRIENLNYGEDGISLDDPLEKIIPHWKGPVIDKNLQFHSKLSENQTAIFAEKGDAQNSLQNMKESPNSNDAIYCSFNGKRNMSPDKSYANPKTLIESSDGASRPGKKTGKEHWQHTKKWSEGFLEVYNAETDPEIKSIMRNMGKDLDRWITEKDIQDVADWMTRIPKRKRKYIEKKMQKIKGEVEMFGPQAVVSKYREYSDEKEEDYLWWLDLNFILCIELYTVEDGNAKVGFYSLEMAADLELNPKQFHVIGFEDPGDSKNFCYIVQAHMDMLGSGRAFVVARPPKDAFREAKANGFSVTVIRKGEVKLNVDQTLEEVEEEITEIGSKIYHDKIMHERSVDIRTLMRGVITAERSTKRSKQMRTKLAKS